MKYSNYKKGFTLIEVIFSLAILGIVIVPIVSLTTSTVKINKQSDDKLKSISIAQKYLEEIKSSSYKLPPNAVFPIEDTKPENGFDIVTKIDSVKEYKIDYGNSSIGNRVYQAEIKSSTDYRNDIASDLNINYSVGLDKVVIELKDNVNSIFTEVNVKFDLTESNNLNNDLKVDLINNSNKELNIYFTKDSKGYIVNQCDGKVKVFTNISDGINTNNNYRLYKVIVDVKKYGKSLQKIEGYKTCLK